MAEHDADAEDRNALAERPDTCRLGLPALAQVGEEVVATFTALVDPLVAAVTVEADRAGRQQNPRAVSGSRHGVGDPARQGDAAVDQTATTSR